jgi:hypothetical protein
MTQVGTGSLVTFPVQSAVGNRSIVVGTTDVITPLRTTSYSFAFWASYDVRQVQALIRLLLTQHTDNSRALRTWLSLSLSQARKVGAASLKMAGNVVSPNSTSVLSALADYTASGQTTFDSLLLGTRSTCTRRRSQAAAS